MTKQTTQVSITLSALLILTLLASMLPQPAQASDLNATGICAKRYIVKNNESLTDVAHRFGIKWRELAIANKIKSPYTIDAGTELCIPSSAGTDSSDANTGTVTVYTSAGRVYITTASFTEDVTYMVKARDAKGNLIPLGKINVRRKARQTQSLTYPSNLRASATAEFCLKNQSTDVQNCFTVTNK